MGNAFENALDVIGEAHVEHLVGLIEHDHFDAVEVQRTATDVVDDAAGSADHDVHAAVECLQLTEDRLATVHRHALRAEVLAVTEERFADLHGQFAGGDQDQRHSLAGGAPVDELQGGQRERCGLTRAGGGLTEEVFAFHQIGDGLTLDGGGLFVAQLVKCLQ